MTVRTASRFARVRSHLEELKSIVGQQAIVTGASFQEAQLRNELFMRLARLDKAVNDAQGDDVTLVRLEQIQARTIANEVRWYARRKNPIIANPIWGRGSEAPDPNLIFWSGPQQIQPVVQHVAEAVGLRVNRPIRPGTDIESARWRELSEATVAFFDVSDNDPQVFYELGIALTMGTVVLILNQEDSGTEIPFDIGQDVIFYTRDNCQEILSSELDAAMYSVQTHEPTESSLDLTIEYAEQITAGHSDDLLRGSAIALRKVKRDPMAFMTAARGFASYLSPSSDVIYPRWPGVYPTARRCFVVMPFREELEDTYRTIRRECAIAGIEPIRGDVAPGQQIILSIWEEISRATNVVVDLTGCNRNVCLELGMADTLGRKSLLIAHEGSLNGLMRGIEKRRVNISPIDPVRSARFTEMLRNFLESKV